ncbi:MAG: nitroreductase family protein [Bacilli bacterium]|nr:nitroreductase family protein [Bacilli bacterium]
MNPIINVINNRTSLRKFSKVPVSELHKKTIIKSAMRAPSAGNLMLYSMILVENKDTLEILSRSCDEQPFIKTASFALIFLVDYQKMYDYFADNNFHSYCLEQDQKAVYPGLSDLLLGSQDAMAAAQNSVIAAESLGVGSCYIGDIIENYELHRELFNLKDLSFPLSMIVFGNYPDNYKPKIQSRFDEKYVLFKEKYRSLSSEELHDMYRENEAKFQSNNPFEAKNAAQVIYAQKIGSEFGLEMKRSVNEIYKRWLEAGYKDE